MSEQQGEQRVDRRVFAFHEVQREFFEAVLSEKFLYMLFGGAIRSGKTLVGLWTLITLCRVFPGSRWAVVRKDGPSLTRNTIPSFNRIRPESFISQPSGKGVARCINGSEIIFFAENFVDDKDYDRWKGLEVCGFLLEEANELQETTFAKAQERAGTWKAAGKRQPMPYIFLTCNPARNWVLTKFYLPWKQGALKAPYYFKRALPDDNPHLTQVYRDSLKNLPPEQYKRFVQGDWDVLDDPSQLISFEWLVASTTREPVAGHRYLGVDVARFGDDFSAIAEREGNALVGMDRMHGLSTTQLGDLVLKRSEETATSAECIRVDSVGLGAGTVDHCRSLHLNVREFNASWGAPADEDFPTLRFRNYRSWAWWKVRELFRHGRISIGVEDPSRLFQDLAAPRYRITGDKVVEVESKDDMKKRLGRSPDEGDAFVMAFADDPSETPDGLAIGGGMGDGSRNDPSLGALVPLALR